jgi:hypothetical protein
VRARRPVARASEREFVFEEVEDEIADLRVRSERPEDRAEHVTRGSMRPGAKSIQHGNAHPERFCEIADAPLRAARELLDFADDEDGSGHEAGGKER